MQICRHLIGPLVSRSSRALFLVASTATLALLALQACGAGPQGACTSPPESGSCVATSADGNALWELGTNPDGSAWALVWCGDEYSPSTTLQGPAFSVDPETGDISFNYDGYVYILSCM